LNEYLEGRENINAKTKQIVMKKRGYCVCIYERGRAHYQDCGNKRDIGNYSMRLKGCI